MLPTTVAFAKLEKNTRPFPFSSGNPDSNFPALQRICSQKDYGDQAYESSSFCLTGNDLSGEAVSCQPSRPKTYPSAVPMTNVNHVAGQLRCSLQTETMNRAGGSGRTFCSGSTSGSPPATSHQKKKMHMEALLEHSPLN